MIRFEQTRSSRFDGVQLTIGSNGRHALTRQKPEVNDKDWRTWLKGVDGHLWGIVLSLPGRRTADLVSMTIFSNLGRWRDTRAQDLIEYALMAGFVAVASGALMPGVASSISSIFSKVGSVLKIASTQGS